MQGGLLCGSGIAVEELGAHRRRDVHRCGCCHSGLWQAVRVRAGKRRHEFRVAGRKGAPLGTILWKQCTPWRAEKHPDGLSSAVGAATVVMKGLSMTRVLGIIA